MNTEILTLGIWQWCPATLTWSADVTNGPAPAQVSQEATPQMSYSATTTTASAVR
ncbi:MAG: hypothetical protein ACLQDV_28290 [Candidatus Binataceae bacterium]